MLTASASDVILTEKKIKYLTIQVMNLNKIKVYFMKRLIEIVEYFLQYSVFELYLKMSSVSDKVELKNIPCKLSITISQLQIIS